MDNYGMVSANSAPPKAHNVIDEAANAIGRINNSYQRLAAIADRLLGSQPRPVGGSGQAGEPVEDPSLKRTVERIHTALSILEAEINRIETRL